MVNDSNNNNNGRMDMANDRGNSMDMINMNSATNRNTSGGGSNNLFNNDMQRGGGNNMMD